MNGLSTTHATVDKRHSFFLLELLAFEELLLFSAN